MNETATEILQRARAREDTRAKAYRPIDYARMNKIGRAQKTALTRAINAQQPGEYGEVRAEDQARMLEVCAKAVREWDEIGAWPDHWSRWQRALDDVFPVFQAPRLEDLR